MFASGSVLPMVKFVVAARLSMMYQQAWMQTTSILSSGSIQPRCAIRRGEEPHVAYRCTQGAIVIELGQAGWDAAVQEAAMEEAHHVSALLTCPQLECSIPGVSATKTSENLQTIFVVLLFATMYSPVGGLQAGRNSMHCMHNEHMIASHSQ
jgi:hypothetical protein